MLPPLKRTPRQVGDERPVLALWRLGPVALTLPRQRNTKRATRRSVLSCDLHYRRALRGKVPIAVVELQGVVDDIGKQRSAVGFENSSKLW